MEAFIRDSPDSTAGTMIGARRFHQDGFKETGKTLSLMSLLVTVYVSNGELNKLGATDPRDRVFALLGLADDAEKLGIYPDYTKSDRTVYIETARKLLTQGHMEVFALSQFPKFNVNLPSWVPDWRGWLREPHEACSDKGFFSAGHGRCSSVESKGIDHDIEVITLEGIRVDKIEQVGASLKAGSDGTAD
jgi:hypothetical protein